MPREKYKPDGEKIRSERTKRGHKNSEQLARAIENRANATPAGSDPITLIGHRTIDEAERGVLSTVHTLRAIAAVLGVGWKDLLLAGHPENQKAFRHPPNSFRDCLRELLSWEQTLGPGTPARIRAIGMDLSECSDWIPTAITGSAAPSLTFELLALTPDPADLPPASPTLVKTFSRNVRNFLASLRESLEGYRGQKPYSLKVKSYAAIPALHGVEVSKGESRHYALSRCESLDGPIPSFDWGRDAYRIFPGDAPDTDLIELRESFVKLFEGHWRTSTALLLDMRSRAGADGSHPE